jgi:hypothetical protein
MRSYIIVVMVGEGGDVATGGALRLRAEENKIINCILWMEMENTMTMPTTRARCREGARWPTYEQG